MSCRVSSYEIMGLGEYWYFYFRGFRGIGFYLGAFSSRDPFFPLG